MKKESILSAKKKVSEIHSEWTNSKRLSIQVEEKKGYSKIYRLVTAGLYSVDREVVVDYYATPSQVEKAFDVLIRKIRKIESK